MKTLFLSALCLFHAASCGTTRVAQNDQDCAALGSKLDPPRETVHMTVGAIALCVEIADDTPERTRGLMFRKELPEGFGMLFVFPDESPRSFWMKNTFVPLSIAFATSDGTITTIKDMTPHDESSVLSHGAATYALEVPKGWFVQNNVQVGDKISIPPSASAPR